MRRGCKAQRCNSNNGRAVMVADFIAAPNTDTAQSLFEATLASTSSEFLSTSPPDSRSATTGMDEPKKPWRSPYRELVFSTWSGNGAPVCLANISSGQKSLTSASPVGSLQAMRAVIRTGAALRSAGATRRDLLLETLALRHQLDVLARSN